MHVGRVVSALFVALSIFVSSAAADDWLPHASDATWSYTWTDSVYNTTPTKEAVTVKESKGTSFVLAWTTDGQGNPTDAPDSTGTVSFQETNAGLLNTDWSSNAPPQAFPILCASPVRCGNSLASTYYNVIWGGRVPVLSEPLIKGATWTSSGGAGNDVASTSRYLGTESITVPAFDHPVTAAIVRSDITQAGALGDPYGSGVRTVWWVYGVGPVKILFEHAGGAGAAVTTAMLSSTNQTAKASPPDDDYFPLKKGLKARYSWTNTKYMKKPSVQDFTVDQVVNSSARVSVKSVKGPIKVAGAYGFTVRTDGVTNIWGTTQAAVLPKYKFPQLGPRSLPKSKRRHFFTPFDLMDYGFNPLFPAYPQAPNNWDGAGAGRDFQVYGVTGHAQILGVQTVKVPAGTFQALAVRTTLNQAGYKFGSGTRTSWFAPNKGLVKLVFKHADRSTSTAVLVK
ncbi:MAG: hypothetical protein ACJ74V_05260 [Gaiellaceae bacterium]